MPKPKIHKLARDAINKLRSENIEPTLDDIIQLHSLAQKTEAIIDPGLLLFQFRLVGNIKIYPMTLGARLWILTTAMKWFEQEQDLLDLAVLYAYANSRTPEKMLKFETPKEARKELFRWASTLNVTQDEITNAFADIVQDDLSGISVVMDLIEQIKCNPSSLDLTKALKYTGGNADVVEHGWVIPYIALLMHYYPGKSEAEWLWDVSEDICFEMIKKAMEFEKGEDSKIDPNDPSLIAFNNFRKAISIIKSRGKSNG